jgi:hypothetical protein
MKVFFRWLGVLTATAAIIILIYFLSPIVILGLSREVQITVTIISGLVGFLAALAQITGYSLQSLSRSRKRKILDKKNEVKDSVPPTSHKYQINAQHGLPPKPFTHLVGRGERVSELMTVLRDPASPLVLSITGIGGIGKTALAYELADQALQEHLFSDVVWFSAKQHAFSGRHIEDLDKGPSTHDDVLDYVHRQLLFESSFKSNQDRDTQLRHLLRSKPYLLVVDNLETLQNETLLVKTLSSLLQPSRAIR